MMRMWRAHSYLPPCTLVRQAHEPPSARHPIAEAPQLEAPCTYRTHPLPAQPSATPAAPYQDYAVVGGFRTNTGKYMAPARLGDAHWEAKGLAKHRDERQMGHYFDFNAWQDERNRRNQLQSRKKPKRA